MEEIPEVPVRILTKFLIESPDGHREVPEVTQHAPNSPTLHMEYRIQHQQLCKL